MIRFGSQVDLVIPDRADIRIMVKPGDRVTAGTSVVATIERISAVAFSTAAATSEIRSPTS
jgi:hypothetical protein